ncbi:MAG TPA: hypothetical protein VK622_13960 [Puia sp.]|nr:hypothetical protein [Puia sp.]
MMQKELLTENDFATVGEEISHELAGSFVQNYMEKYPNDMISYHIGRNIIEHILAQPGCVGMRFYNALNEAGKKTLVYVGIDASGKDIVKKVVVQEDGTLATVKASVADRAGSSDDGFNLWTWLFGG